MPVLTPGTGTAGLPVIRFIGTGSAQHLSIEFVRRKTGGILYTPQFNNTPDAASWQSATAPPVVTSIDANWERVIVEDLATTGANTTRFGRVLVSRA